MNGFVPPAGRMLPDGKRLHLQHGPIDLIIGAFGPGRQAALSIAEERFQTILSELVEELEQLRQPCRAGQVFSGSTARRMQKATSSFLPQFITPMAAVAGSVADEVLDHMLEIDDLDKVYVNNGGDTAIYLRKKERMKAAIAAPFEARIHVKPDDDVGGIATSGWGGRSHSLGIADSVSVLAEDCATADAAATLIANAVNLPDNKNIARMPASELFPDSDLGGQLVTTDVGNLTDEEIKQALHNGQQFAKEYLDRGLIKGAFIIIANQYSTIGKLNFSNTETGVRAIA